MVYMLKLKQSKNSKATKHHHTSLVPIPPSSIPLCRAHPLATDCSSMEELKVPIDQQDS